MQTRMICVFGIAGLSISTAITAMEEHDKESIEPRDTRFLEPYTNLAWNYPYEEYTVDEIVPSFEHEQIAPPPPNCTRKYYRSSYNTSYRPNEKHVYEYYIDINDPGDIVDGGWLTTSLQLDFPWKGATNNSPKINLVAEPIIQTLIDLSKRR